MKEISKKYRIKEIQLKLELTVGILEIYFHYIQGSLNKFADFFRMGTFIDSTHIKL